MSQTTADSSQSPQTTTEPSPSSLLSTPPPKHTAVEIPLHLIDTPDPNNGRAAVDSARVTQLASSIARIGLLNPITVLAVGDRYTLAAGLHRLRAAQQLSLQVIPATVLSTGDAALSVARLAENSARSNLSPVEEAMQLEPLVEADPNGIDGVAAAIGRTRAWIDTRLEILSWPAELVAAVHAKKIPLGAANKLARIPDPAMRNEMVYQAATHGINTRTAVEWLRQATADTSNLTETPLGSRGNSETQFSTETKVNCFRCQTLTLLEDTNPVRICTSCIHDLTGVAPQPAARNAPQDPNTPGSTGQKPFPESLIPSERLGPHATNAPA